MSVTRRHADPDALEHVLTSALSPSAAEWAHVCHALVTRADAEGLIDVAVELHDSPLGTLLLGATAQGLVRVGLPAEGEDEVMHELARRVSPRVLTAPRDTLSLVRRQLDEYFAGRRRAFEVRLDWRLTGGFRLQVLRATARVPYGETASYREVATRAGSPAAVRAAGTALATNPLPIVVPCHRVVRTGGALGAYRGGAQAKLMLLRLEGFAG